MVRLASIHLDGLGLQWHLNYMRQKFDIYPSWSQYVTYVTTHFGDVYEDPLFLLLQVKHNGQVQEYIEQFELDLTQVNLISEHSLSILLVGLNYNIQMHVRMFNPITNAHVANLEKLHEASIPPPPKTNFHSPSFTKNTCLLNKPIMSPPSSSPTIPTGIPNTNQRANFPQQARTYSALEMAGRIAKGLCMFCDEQFTSGYQLKHITSQLMVLEVNDDDESPEDDSVEAVPVADNE